MARKQSRRITSSQGSGKGSSGARKRKSKPSILRHDPWGKPTRPETRRRVFAAAALVRRGEASLSEALRQEHTTLRSFLKFPRLYRRQSRRHASCHERRHLQARRQYLCSVAFPRRRRAHCCGAQLQRSGVRIAL